MTDYVSVKTERSVSLHRYVSCIQSCMQYVTEEENSWKLKLCFTCPRFTPKSLNCFPQSIKKLMVPGEQMDQIWTKAGRCLRKVGRALLKAAHIPSFVTTQAGMRHLETVLQDKGELKMNQARCHFHRVLLPSVECSQPSSHWNACHCLISLQPLWGKSGSRGSAGSGLTHYKLSCVGHD